MLRRLDDAPTHPDHPQVFGWFRFGTHKLLSSCFGRMTSSLLLLSSSLVAVGPRDTAQV